MRQSTVGASKSGRDVERGLAAGSRRKSNSLNGFDSIFSITHCRGARIHPSHKQRPPHPRTLRTVHTREWRHKARPCAAAIRPRTVRHISAQRYTQRPPRGLRRAPGLYVRARRWVFDAQCSGFSDDALGVAESLFSKGRLTPPGACAAAAGEELESESAASWRGAQARRRAVRRTDTVRARTDTARAPHRHSPCAARVKSVRRTYCNVRRTNGGPCGARGTYVRAPKPAVRRT